MAPVGSGVKVQLPRALAQSAALKSQKSPRVACGTHTGSVNCS